MTEQAGKQHTAKKQPSTRRANWSALFTIITLTIIIATVVFVVHVPLLKLFSNAKFWPKTADHLSIEVGMYPEHHNENMKIYKVFKGSIRNLWYYPSEQSFFIYGSLTDELGFAMFKFTKDGQLWPVSGVTQEKIDEFNRTDQLIRLPTTHDKEHRYSHGFYADQSVFTLDHFEFQTFQWPYFHYFLPKFGFNWEGMAYVSMNFYDNKLSFKIPMKYSSFLAYTDGGVAAYLYYTPIEIEDHPYKLALFRVDESHYSRPMSGDRTEQHRPGYGIYLMTLKKDNTSTE